MELVFKFITEWEGVNLQELACMAYNLGLMYFMWDVAKFMLGFLANKFKLGGGKR